MFGTKGYRSRENAAKQRNNRKLVSDEVRAQRTAILAKAAGEVADEPVAADTPVEVEVEASEAPKAKGKKDK